MKELVSGVVMRTAGHSYSAAEAQKLAELAVLPLRSPSSRRNYAREIRRFLASGLPLTRTGILTHLQVLEQAGAGPVTRNIALSAVRLLAGEAWERNELSDGDMSAIERIKQTPVRGTRAGNWLDLAGVRVLLEQAGQGPQGARNQALVALMAGCGLRRSELAALDWSQWQQRDGRWCLVDIVGKGGRVRTVAVPDWAAERVAGYLVGLQAERHMFPVTPQAMYLVVRDAARRAGLGEIRPHDLRRTFARLSREGGAPLEQVQHQLGHASVQTTERYIASHVDLRQGCAAGDFIRLGKSASERQGTGGDKTDNR